MTTDYLNVALPLGIGGATPFPMSSNHATVGNHSFRDLKRPSIMTASEQSKHKKQLQQQQLRVKCAFCGCWATRGENCKQCRRPIAPAQQRRNNNVRVTVHHVGEGGPQSESTMIRSRNGTKKSPSSPNDNMPISNLEGSKGTRSARLSSYGQRMREELLQRRRQHRSDDTTKKDRSSRGRQEDARAPSSYAFPSSSTGQQGKNGSAPAPPDMIIGVDHQNSEIPTSDQNGDVKGSAALQEQTAAADVTANMAKTVVKCKRCACFALTNVPCSLCFYVNQKDA